MAEQQIVFILLREKPGLEASNDKDNKNPWECKVQKGDIVEEIPYKDRVPNPDHPTHNYRLYTEPDVTLFTIPTDVSVLHGKEVDYLLAVHPPSARVKEYLNTQQLKEKMEIKMGDLVIFRYSIKKDAPGGSFVHGKVQYIGFVRDSEGIYFGIEILDEKHRGKGINGRHYFNSGGNNAAFVSIDNVSKKSTKIDQPPPPEPAANTRSHKERNTSPVVHRQPTSDNPQGRIDDGPPAANTRSSHKEASNPSMFQKAKAGFVNLFGNDPPITKGESLPNVQYQYKPGDRVVLHSVHNVPIYGTVRWTGHVRENKISMPVVGVETVKKINVDRDLPDTHLKVTDGHGHELFKVALDHSRVFVPEQLVVRDYEYLEQRKKDDEIQYEQKVAKEYGLTVEEYRAQKEILDQANKERDVKHDQKANQQPFIPPDPPIEEEGTAGTGHGGVEDSVALVTSGQPVSDERMEEERKALERFNSQIDNQPPHPLYHEYEEIPSLIQQRVIEGSAGNGASAGSSHGNPPAVYQNIPVNEIQAIKHGRSPNMSNRENYSSLPSILNDRQPSVPVSSSPLNIEDQFAIGSMVVIPTQGGTDPLKGVVKWIGTLPEVPGLIAGVELVKYYWSI
jgi:ubiquitin thioesterase CYLD